MTQLSNWLKMLQINIAHFTQRPPGWWRVAHNYLLHLVVLSSTDHSQTITCQHCRNWHSSLPYWRNEVSTSAILRIIDPCLIWHLFQNCWSEFSVNSSMCFWRRRMQCQKCKVTTPKQDSTESALLRFFSDICRALDGGNVCFLGLLDLKHVPWQNA